VLVTDAAGQASRVLARKQADGADRQK
jgi:hypothetical protein